MPFAAFKRLVMKQIIKLLLCMIPVLLTAQTRISETYQRLPFGSIKPAGWLKTQMQKDLNGFVGNLDQLVPDLIHDPIYGAGRLQRNSKSKDLGNLKSGDAEGEEQYKWWNSETQSNWWDGYLRNALLLEDVQHLEKIKTYIDRMLATQDADGYLGIYDTDLRYQFQSENGELWAKATLYRGLLAYYEATQETRVWDALVGAVDNVMQHYPIHQSNPFYNDGNFSGGISHGLTFTDVLDRMYQLTGNTKYWDYAAFLYENFCTSVQSEKDAQLENILDPNYKLQAHGVHTYEHLRPLLVATYATGRADLQRALDIYLKRIQNVTTLTGGPIGDEWIAGRSADATHTGYEYCSIHELLDSYATLFQKSGNPAMGDQIETIFYNAAQGSRNPLHSCIAYLKTDNSYEMLGTKNGEIEPDRKQTRYKYSPAHQDVAVCCNPNAGRITPYFLQSSWMKENEQTLVATLLMPNVLETTIAGTKINIENATIYPYEHQLNFLISLEKPTAFILKIRKPAWATAIQTKESYKEEGSYIVIQRTFAKKDLVQLEFITTPQVKTDLNQAHYFTYGALVYAKAIAAAEQVGRKYAPGFNDLTYTPTDTNRYEFIPQHKVSRDNNTLIVNLKNSTTGKTETVQLIPFGNTILRQVSF